MTVLQVGDTFGSYRVVRLLGQGGMGSVYLLEDEQGGYVAAKILDPGVHGDFEYRARFMREAEIALKIKSPALVTVFDIGEDPDTGLCYILMEYVGGGTLKNVLDERGPLPIAEALEYVLEVAKALKDIHSYGVVHRDIKPDNIMFTEDGRIKIADLGIARGGKIRATTITKNGFMIGTPAYMAPEQMVDSHHVGAKSDMYALGIVLHELLTGRRPFHDLPFMELMANAIKGERIPDIRTEKKEIPLAVSKLVAKMCEPKAENRFANMAEVIAEIIVILEGKSEASRVMARYGMSIAVGLFVLMLVIVLVKVCIKPEVPATQLPEEAPIEEMPPIDVVEPAPAPEEPALIVEAEPAAEVKPVVVETEIAPVIEEKPVIVEAKPDVVIEEEAKKPVVELKEAVSEPVQEVAKKKEKAKPKKPKTCSFMVGNVSLVAKASEEKRAKEVADFGNKTISLTRRIMALPTTTTLGKGKIKKFALDSNSTRVYLNPVTKVYHIGELSTKQKIFEAVYELVIKEAEFAKDAADKSLEQFVKMQVSRSLGLEYNRRALNREQRLWQVVFDRDSQIVSKYLSTRKYFYRQGILMGKMSTADFVATLSRAHNASLFLFCQEAGFAAEERKTIINCRDLRKFKYDSSDLDFVSGRITDPFDF